MKNLTDFRKTVETGVDPRLNYDCLIQGSRAGILDLPYPSFRGTCTVAICNNHRTL